MPSRRCPAFLPCLVLVVTVSSVNTLRSQTFPASTNFTEAAENHPSPAPVKQVPAELQGDILTARQRYLAAIEAYRLASQDSAVVANKIGVAYHHMFDIADARRYYQRAVQLDPHYAEAINNLGATYHAEKNYREAARLYRKAIKYSPRSPLFYSNLGTAYFFAGKFKKGSDAYRTALSLDPTVFDHSNASQIEEATSIKALATVNYFLAKTYAQAGMNERALFYLRKALGEGFNDRKKLMGDREFASLRETPEFTELIGKARTQ